MRYIILALVLILSSTACNSSKSGYESTRLTPTPGEVVAPPKTSAPVVYGTITQLNYPTPATTSIPDPDMYVSVASKFFTDAEVSKRLQPSILHQKTVYIDPTFINTEITIPSRIIDIIRSHAELVGLNQVEGVQNGGSVVSVSSVNAINLKDQTQQVIEMVLGVNGGGCGTFIHIGYLLTQTNRGWEAEPYSYGVC